MMSTNNREVGILDYLLILGKWRNLIVVTFLLSFTAAIIISLLLPKYYKATVVFLPPSQSSGITSLLRNLPIDVLGSNDITGEACLTILKSRELRQSIIEKFDLMKLYQKKYIEHTLIELDSKVIINPEYQVAIGTSSITSIELSVIDKSPQRAADMANEFLRLLEERIIELNTQKAKNNRLFLGTRLEQNKHDLRAAEDSLKSFQEKYGAIEISAQSKASIQAASELKAEMLSLEVELNILKKNLLPDNAELDKINTRLQAMRQEYENLYEKPTTEASQEDVLLPIKQIPSLALRYYRAFRETEVQNRLYEMIVPLYEQAKIQEDKTIPVLKVIDTAIPPTYKYKPKRLFLVLGMVSVSMIFSLLYIFYREYLNHLREHNFETYSKVLTLRDILAFRRRDKVSG